MMATRQWERVRRFMPRLNELMDVLPDDLHGRVVREHMRKTESTLRTAVDRGDGPPAGATARAAFAAAMAECAHLVHLIVAAGLVQSERAADVEREARELAAAAKAKAARGARRTLAA